MSFFTKKPPTRIVDDVIVKAEIIAYTMEHKGVETISKILNIPRQQVARMIGELWLSGTLHHRKK